ncbi:MAG: DsbA family protein [Propionibacteriaceae bacterium]|jgi:protein-disulfide isomerase|nr:DsbA family protein [Propionibacteriaceae bacterium]
MATSRSQASRSRRAELEKQRLAKAKRDRQVRLAVFGGGGVVIVAVLVVLIVALNLYGRGGDVTPPHANEAGTGLVLNADAAAIVPQLDVYADFQCPICKALETSLGDSLSEIADSGEAKVVIHIRSFLDYLNTSSNPNSSTRSAVAAACVDTLDGDLYLEAMGTIFDNQPATEGDGYTDAFLRDSLPALLGVAGDQLTAYQTCYDDRQTGQFVQAVDDAASAAGVNSTPTYKLNGTDITTELRSASDPSAALRQLILDATDSTV